jgi:hypothetical protein
VSFEHLIVDGPHAGQTITAPTLVTQIVLPDQESRRYAIYEVSFRSAPDGREALRHTGFMAVDRLASTC